MTARSASKDSLRRLAVGLMDHVPGSLAARLRSDTLAGRVLRPLANSLAGVASQVVTVRSGVARGARLEVNPGLEKFYWTGSYEARVQEQIANRLRTGMTFWDVGAHIGFFSVLASRLVGSSGRIHAFEPNPDSLSRLKKNLELNDIGNVEVHPVAVSATTGSALLHRHPSSFMWSLKRCRGDAGSIAVDCVSLDSMAEQLGTPDLIKIDVEGAEAEVLAGASNLLSRASTTLIMEFVSDGAVEQAREALPSYSFVRLDKRNWLLAPANPHLPAPGD